VNLTNNPTCAELADLLAGCDDAAASHVLWVTNSGEVHLDPLPTGVTPAGYERLHEKELKFRWETFHRGNDYVGPNAARDEAWVAKLLAELEHLWNSGFRGYSDYWQADSLA
jgi:hypothetical protein